MKKIIYKIIITFITLLILTVVYLSTIGIQTNKFNSKIINQIKQIEPNIDLTLQEVSAKLDFFNFGLKVETFDSDLLYQDKIIKILNIRTYISLRSIIDKSFALTEVNLSTKSLKIRDLFAFVRLINNNPKIFIAEQFVKDGSITLDIKLEFDNFGKIKKNYKINGFVKKGKINLLKKYDLNKINFIFRVDNENIVFDNLELFLNNKKIFIPKLKADNLNNGYIISGVLKTPNTNISKNDFDGIVKNYFNKYDIKEISLGSNNNFKFKINKNFKFEDFELKSVIDIYDLQIKNSFQLKNFFPQINEEIVLKNQKINLEFKDNDLILEGAGEILLQNKLDKFEYNVVKKKSKTIFEGNLTIIDNPFESKLLNYKKKENSELKLAFKFSQGKNIIFDRILLTEEKNNILIKDLLISKNYEIKDVGVIKIDFIDKENFENKLQINKKKNDYKVIGNSFNINNIVEELLSSKTSKKLKFFDKKLRFSFDIKKIFLDQDYITKNLEGFIIMKNNEISELDLVSNFTNQKKIKFTIKTNDDEKITTLFSDNAKPMVNRYKFIKGFDEGSLDFYSVNKKGKTKSTIKIYDFKLKELPILTKILTLASLQGIADLLSGEGIRFSEFEMNFTNKKDLITIDEIYAIGPAISVMLEGYIEKDKLISLRGTLVPATTINKTIGSIPLLGNILVGKKTGEGVFGVSFKIKGPPKNLETSVNPIKTLTPRFITRTLEKIKKPN